MARAVRKVRLDRSLWGLSLTVLMVVVTVAAAACGESETSSSTTSSTQTTATVGASQFGDVALDHFYYAQISDLAARGIVSGFEDGSFQPDEWVTRQQFAKMIVLAQGYPVSENDVCSFGDVQKDAGSLYPDNYVAVCAAEGVTQGKTSTHFAPYDNMSRAQLITMVARAAGLSELPPGEPPFADFSADHYPWAAKAYQAGLLDGLEEFKGGYSGAYDFWDNATRGEVCALLYSLLQQDQ